MKQSVNVCRPDAQLNLLLYRHLFDIASDATPDRFGKGILVTDLRAPSEKPTKSGVSPQTTSTVCVRFPPLSPRHLAHGLAHGTTSVVVVDQPCAKSRGPDVPEHFKGKFTQSFLADPPVGTFTDGSGLYFAVRSGGNARSWSARERGRRISIGPYAKLDLKAAQAKLREIRDRQAKGEDPFTVANEVKTATPDIGGETYASATRAFVNKKLEDGVWIQSTYDQRQAELNKYIYSTAYANKPLKEITARDILAIFKPTWKTTAATALRCASMLQEMFAEAIKDDPPRHPGPKNPADMDSHGWLRRKLGGQGPRGNRHGMLAHDVPTLVKFLQTPPFAHGPDELSTAEAAEAFEIREDAINVARRQGKLKKWRKLGSDDFQNATYVYNRAELEHFWRLKKAPRVHARIPMVREIMLFIIWTAVREDMACKLRWTQVQRKNPRGPLIDFAKNPDNTPLIRGHKTEGQDEADYTIPLTPDLDALLHLIEQEQKADGLYDGKGHVFVHPPCRVGRGVYKGKTVNPHAVNNHYQRVMKSLRLVRGQRIPSIHGLRKTFPEWAMELNNFNQDLVEAQLGHKHKLGGRNWMYYRGITLLNQRRQMMEAWEKYIKENAPKEPIKANWNHVMAYERSGVLLNQTASAPLKPWEVLGMSRESWYRYGQPKTRPPEYRKSIKELAAMVREMNKE
jgi:integrase